MIIFPLYGFIYELHPCGILRLYRYGFLLLFLSKKRENRSKIIRNKLLLIALKSILLLEAPKVTAHVLG